jgi:hypothetical protein
LADVAYWRETEMTGQPPKRMIMPMDVWQSPTVVTRTRSQIRQTPLKPDHDSFHEALSHSSVDDHAASVYIPTGARGWPA